MIKFPDLLQLKLSCRSVTASRTCISFKIKVGFHETRALIQLEAVIVKKHIMNKVMWITSVCGNSMSALVIVSDQSESEYQTSDLSAYYEWNWRSYHGDFTWTGYCGEKI